MSRNNEAYVSDQISPTAPPRSDVYDEVPIPTQNREMSSIPPVYPKRTIITVQPQNEADASRRKPIPVNTAGWVSTPRSQLSALSGKDFLAGIEQLEIQQTVELSTLLGESSSGNQYRVKVPRAETIYLAMETSSECQRKMLGSSRGFSLSLIDPTGQVAFTFTKNLSWGCIPGLLHKMTVCSEYSDRIGSIEQNFTLIGPSFTVYDASKNPLCKIYGPNMCCCCMQKDTQFQIVSIDGTHQIASLMNHWDHLLADYTLTLTVPSETNVTLKGLLLGAAFLMEYLYFHHVK